MANAFARFGITDDQFAKLLTSASEVDAGLQQFMRDEVVPAWKNHPDTPVDSGAYAASIKIVRKARYGKGAVAATDYKAHWIEFGTGEPGPTQAFGVAEKVARKFGGKLDSGVNVAKELEQ